ncbi:MAG: hypothetical protein J6O04_09590 [Selenomonadaceae bacterium]|nr:hypothetical protein [Selenomonadaceae bacterium]
MNYYKSRNHTLYEFLKQNPTASLEEIAETLGWTKRQVSKYRCNLKKYGYIDYDFKPNSNEISAMEFLKPFSPKDEPEETFTYKQDIYRQIVEACLDKINNPETTVGQTIELMRELRLILKEMR